MNNDLEIGQTMEDELVEMTRELETETLDRLFLEWSQFTKARTAREKDANDAASKILHMLANPSDENIEQAKTFANHIMRAFRF